MMISSCLLTAVNACVYAVHRWEPESSLLVSSFIRIAVNLVVIFVYACVKQQWKILLGDRSIVLWLRGVFGAATIVLGFASLQTIQMGRASFLLATSSSFVALLGPIILGQRNSRWVWFALLGSLVGASLIFDKSASSEAFWGQFMALTAALSMALAYLMIAKSGKASTAASVVWHFCLVGIVVHAIIFAIIPQKWPQDPRSYALLLSAGVIASGSQYFVTAAYQRSKASLVAAAGGIGPVLNLLVSVVLFDERIDLKGILGALVILICSGGLPFLLATKTQAQRVR